MKAYFATVCGGFIIVAALALTGCSSDGRPTLLPNADANLRKSSTEFAADAAKRSYETDAPKSNLTIARAQYNLMERQFDMANLTNWDWQNIEVWVNQKYVVSVPQFSKNSGKALNFELFYDNTGHHFETNHGGNPVKSLQIYADGKMYDVVATLQ
jgi:major membrane immunogen (membrane-anchored lipoprotein)